MSIGRTLLCDAAVFSAAATAVLASPAADAQSSVVDSNQVKPNIVLFLVDDARVDDLSTMPGVTRRIGNAGATFKRFYASFPLCSPARATLLSGEYAHNHGVLNNTGSEGGFNAFDDDSTLATWLDPDYRTGLVGKYLNDYRAAWSTDPAYEPPGWDEWVTPRTLNGYFRPFWWVDTSEATGATGSRRELPGYSTDTTGDFAADFVTRNAASDEPFFLYASFGAPHAGPPAEPDDPQFPTPAVSPDYQNLYEGLAITDPAFNEADVSDKPRQPAPLTPAQVAGLTEVNAQRHEADQSVQDAIDQTLDALSASGEADNTYVMFMSDNGFMIGEHRITGGKLIAYEPSARVPFMVAGPGIKPGRMITAPTSQVDFAPTVLSMAGQTAPGPARLDGMDLLPSLLDPSLPVDRTAVLLEATDLAIDPPPWRYHGIVDRRWKYVAADGTNVRELYDLRSDPSELQNLAGLPEYAAVQKRMSALLDRYRNCSGPDCP